MSVALAVLAAAVPTHAANFPGLYDVVVPSSDKPGASSFAEALRLVAVRVTGSREAAEQLAASKPDARRYITKFSFRPDGSAEVGFDSIAFDKLLTSAGLPIWGRERPAVAVWLEVPDAAGRLGWIGAGDRGPERDIVERVAKARGLPLIWPAMDASDLATAVAMTTSARSYSQLMASSERYHADAVLLGVGTRDGSGGVTVRWTFAFNEEVVDLQGGIADGVDLAADRCGRLLAVAPGAHATVDVQVRGVGDLDAYARTLNYLEGVTLVVAGGVTVQELRGDTLELQVTVRGDATALRRTIALGRRLVEIPQSSDAQSHGTSSPGTVTSDTSASGLPAGTQPARLVYRLAQ